MIPSKFQAEIELIPQYIGHAIVELHSFGYEDANFESIFTNPIYSHHFKHMCNNRKGKNSQRDIVLDFLISQIK